MSNGSLSSWIDRTAVDRDGVEIGTVVDIYVDDATGQPEWLAVKTGRSKSSVSFVPLEGAGPRGDDVAVAYDKGRVTGAPSAEPDGALTLDEEADLYAHYGLEYSTRRSESGLPEGPAPTEPEYVEVEVAEVVAEPAAPRLRRRRPEEDFDMMRLSSKDVPIVVKQRKDSEAR